MTKRTLEGTKKKACKKSGFRARLFSSAGRKLIKKRRKRGRKFLTH